MSKLLDNVNVSDEKIEAINKR